MAKFLYLYSGGQIAETPEAQEEEMQAWTAWFGTFGDSVVDIGNPFGAARQWRLAALATAGRPSWAVTRSSTLSPLRPLRRRLTVVRCCSPAAALRCTRLCLCDRRPRP
jgi:hypothetical protein